MKLPTLILLAGAAGLAVSLRAFGTADADAQDRTQATYYANGRVDSEYEIRDGRRDGPCRRFYPDGSRMAEGRYAAGRMQGEWTFWGPDGRVDPERSGFYESGEKLRADPTR